MPSTELRKILTSVGERIVADFNQSKNFKHDGERGTTRELIWRDFLAGYLPSHVEAVHNAEVTAHDGTISPQCDILLIDRGTPPLTTLKGFNMIPNECVYGMVEVKSNLTKEKLEEGCDKIRDLRKLKKDAYTRIPGTLKRTIEKYGQTYDYFPTVGMVIAFSGSNLDTLAKHLLAWCRKHDHTKWPDSVWVLGQGFLQWGDVHNGKIRSLFKSPKEGASLVHVKSEPKTDILLALALHLNQQFSEAWMNPLNLAPYAGSEPFGTYAGHWDVY